MSGSPMSVGVPLSRNAEDLHPFVSERFLGVPACSWAVVVQLLPLRPESGRTCLCGEKELIL